MSSTPDATPTTPDDGTSPPDDSTTPYDPATDPDADPEMLNRGRGALPPTTGAADPTVTRTATRNS